MYSLRNMQKCRLLFFFYFIIIAAFPYSHSHADSESYLVRPDSPMYSSAHSVSDVRHNDHYTDSHNSYDVRHLHFLAEDSNSASRPLAVEKTAPIRDIAISKIVIVQLAKQSVITMIQDRVRSYPDGFHSPYSGLSPPSC